MCRWLILVLFFVVLGTGTVLGCGFAADICHRVRDGHALPERQQRAEAPRQRLQVPHLRALLRVRQRRVDHVRPKNTIRELRGV